MADQKRARELLDTVLERLPTDLRTVFVLFEIEGLSQDEVALSLDVPKGTVASRLRRARQRLARRLVSRQVVDQASGGVL